MTMPPDFKFALITSCSSSRTIEPIARVGKIPPGQTMQSALAYWADMLTEGQNRLTTPGELYRGLGFATIAKIQEMYHPSDIRIVTGGQGLISLDEKIVPYDFTASKNEPENIYQAVTQEPFVQTVWWRKINTLRGKAPLPIQALTIQTNYDLYLISMGKVFVRYISEDVLGCDPRKVRILLASSSVGSVPAQLRPYIIPFDRSILAHMPGNRNDSNHRAAQHFLHLCDTIEGFATAPVEEQRQHFISNTPVTHRSVDIPALLSERPHLLEMDAEQAYNTIRKEFGTFGGKQMFRSEYRKAKGLEVEAAPLDDDAAITAFDGLTFLKQSNQTSTNEEDEVLSIIKAFTQALAKFTNNVPTPFTAANVCEWAKNYYKDALHPTLQQPNKVAYILKNNAAYLGLKETDISGAKSYIAASNLTS